MTQTNVEIWRHEITSDAGPEDVEGRRVELDRADPKYQWYLGVALNSPPDCPAQWLGTVGGGRRTMWRCGVGYYRQCYDSEVDVRAIVEEREDGQVTSTRRYDVYGVTGQECEALREEITQGRIDSNRPDRTLEQLMREGKLPQIESPRLREVSEQRIQEERQEERRIPVMILHMPGIHEVGGGIRRRGGNGDGPKEEEPLLEKMAA